MKQLFYLLFALSALSFNVSAQGEWKIPENVKRVLFLGNSITYSGQYVAYVEAYIRIMQPDRKIEFINAGLPSETVSGLSEEGHAGGRFPRPDLHERLQRVLDQTKPDLVFACYGMNDGIYLPFDDLRFGRFRDGINWLHQEVTGTGALIVHITPPVYDERKGEAYSNVLDIYSDWLISCRYSSDWKVIDVHWPMKKYLQDKRLADSAFFLAKDGVHPNETGHWLIAKQILMFLGEKGVAAFDDPASAFLSVANGEAALKLVRQREEMMRDAWLTSTGHKRPEMKTGIPLDEAKKKADESENQIFDLLKKNQNK
jgi:lysophospholipase L1-like esterase